jgi:phospholipase/carboxylesterase
MQQLDGPRIEPQGRAPTALVVLLHGYGANGDDLIGLADSWQPSLRSVAFVAPNAPEAIPGMHGGLLWFPLTLRDPSEYWRGVVAARPAIDRFIDSELSRYKLPPDRLVLVGFSQGTMMALHVGLRRPQAAAGIVGYSGLLAGPEYLSEAKVCPPILLIHGEADDLIPVGALHMAREHLANSNVPVEWHIRPGVGHGIDSAGQWMAAHFIASVLKETRPG